MAETPVHSKISPPTQPHREDAGHNVRKTVSARAALTVSPAQRYNQQIMEKLQKALEADPEVDLSSLFPVEYTIRLNKRKVTSLMPEDDSKKARKLESSPAVNVLQIDDTATVEVLFPLSESVRMLFESGGSSDNRLSAENINTALADSELLFKHGVGGTIVLECKPGIVVKVRPNARDSTEYTTLRYLEKLDLPVPKPLGAARIDRYSLYFMSKANGSTLEEVWPELDHDLKRSVQNQLNDALLQLRGLPKPENQPLGGVAGERCKDLRRHTRVSDHTLLTAQEFEDFQFSNPHYGSKIYIEFLRSLAPPLTNTCVFSHGDLRPENIMVKFTGDACTLTSIIDWEYSGFYPEFYEMTKVTNSLATNDESDWFKYIPDCISPRNHPWRWLLDRLWWKHVE